MKLILLIAILTFFSINDTFSQQNELKKAVEELTESDKKTKVTHIYMILYKDKNGNHLRKPKKAYRSEGESLDDVKKRIASQEKGKAYSLNTTSSINKDRPYGVLYSTTKNGVTKYKLGTYTTQKYAQKMCEEKERYGGKCIEVISLN